MPTAKKRINITIDDDAYEALERLASKRKKTVSSVGLKLIEQGLELEEDAHFSRVADERLRSGGRRVAHSKIWGR